MEQAREVEGSGSPDDSQMVSCLLEFLLSKQVHTYNFQVSGPTDAGIQVCPENANVFVQCNPTLTTVGKILTNNCTYQNSPLHFLGLQTIAVPKKDVSIQCSLLPAPPLSLLGKRDCQPHVESLTDMDTDVVTTEVDDSDTDYMTDSISYCGK